MNDPIERLQRVAAAHMPAGLPDVDGLARDAVALRLRRGGMGGAVVATVLALALVATGGSSSQSLDVVDGGRPTAPDGPISVDESRTPVGGGSVTGSTGEHGRAPAVGGDGARPDVPRVVPLPGTGSRKPNAPSPTPTGPPAQRAYERPAWLRQIPLGAAPYYAESVRGYDSYCAGAGSVEHVDQTQTGFCMFADLELPERAGGDFVAKYVVCKHGEAAPPSSLSFATEQEVELTIWRTADAPIDQEPRPAYRWSEHRSFAATPHSEDVLGKCLVYAWHLALADDGGQPLISGESYRVEWMSLAPEMGRHYAMQWSFVAP